MHRTNSAPIPETPSPTPPFPESPDFSQALPGSRRLLTQEAFEHLCALQCTPEEIAGYTGATLKQLSAWCRKLYHKPLDKMMSMIRMDGLIEIREASFSLLTKNATLISKQMDRFIGLPGPTPEEQARAMADAGMIAVRQFVEMASPSPDDVQSLFPQPIRTDDESEGEGEEE